MQTEVQDELQRKDQHFQRWAAEQRQQWMAERASMRDEIMRLHQALQVLKGEEQLAALRQELGDDQNNNDDANGKERKAGDSGDGGTGESRSNSMDEIPDQAD